MSRSDGSTADYYELPDGCAELQELISHRDMNAQIGEIFRACYRYGIVSHSDKLRDAKKMRFYADAEVKRLENLAQKEEPAAAIDDESPRQQRIQQSGEMAEEVYAAVDSDGWIEWHGGECPVEDWRKVDIKYKAATPGVAGYYPCGREAGLYFWGTSDYNGCITHYRLSKDA